MTKQTFGATISALRKEKGLTQLELARQMGVTDKAVSKWERNLSFPDVASLPKLAEVLGTCRFRTWRRCPSWPRCSAPRWTSCSR